MGADAATAKRVEDNELVCRVCHEANVAFSANKTYPDVIDPETKLLRTEEIQCQDLVGRGFSVQRLAQYSRRMAEATCPARDRRYADRNGGVAAGFRLAGAVVGLVERIHAIREEETGVQVFSVVEYPVEGEPGHAEIHLNPRFHARSQVNKWRLALRKALGPLRAPEDVPWAPDDFVAAVEP